METLATESSTNESRLSEETSRLTAYTASLIDSLCKDSARLQSDSSDKLLHPPPDSENDIIMTILKGLVPSQNFSEARSPRSSSNYSKADPSSRLSSRYDGDGSASSLHLLAHISKSLIDAKYKCACAPSYHIYSFNFHVFSFAFSTNF